MNDTMVINTLEDLKAFLNEKGVLEIALRNQKKRFKSFQKVLISSQLQSEDRDFVHQVIKNINKVTNLNEQNLKQVSSLARVQMGGMVLNIFNLCATYAGFAILCNKLDAMSEKLKQEYVQLNQTVRQTHDIRNEFEFNQVLAKHMDMLDSRHKQQPYSEEKLRELVDLEYSVLSLLISTFQKNISSDNEALVFAIFSLLGMFTVSLCSFDEIYYFNKKEVIENTEIWHLSHERWMGVYNIMTSDWFIEKLQDYSYLEAKLSTTQTDAYCSNLQEQVHDLREEVEDNQKLVVALGNINQFSQYQSLSRAEIVNSIKKAFHEAGTGFEESKIASAYNEAIQMASLA